MYRKYIQYGAPHVLSPFSLLFPSHPIHTVTRAHNDTNEEERQKSFPLRTGSIPTTAQGWESRAKGRVVIHSGVLLLITRCPPSVPLHSLPLVRLRGNISNGVLFFARRSRRAECPFFLCPRAQRAKESWRNAFNNGLSFQFICYVCRLA
jgi:hypothetical protein